MDVDKEIRKLTNKLSVYKQSEICNQYIQIPVLFLIKIHFKFYYYQILRI